MALGYWGILGVLLTLQLGREEDDMVVCSLAEVEQRQRLALWCLERQLEPSACSAPLVSQTLTIDPKEGGNALFRSPRNLEYPACSAASSRTTSSLSPVVLMADTTVASTRTAKDRSDLMVAQQEKKKARPLLSYTGRRREQKGWTVDRHKTRRRVFMPDAMRMARL